jgi:hypothetical protein
MASKRYTWKRYWVPREGAFAFDSDGFLLSPVQDPDLPTWIKTDVVDFENLAASPCLVLLGEPGIGKSYALRDVRNYAENAGSPANFVSINLGGYADEGRLIKDIFECPEFHTWKSLGTEWHLFLDSFDECLLRLDTVASLLAKCLTELPTVNGLFLRLTSRTAEWHTGLEEAMKSKWGDEKVSVFELAPLTKEQVYSAATANISDPEKFLTAIVEREVVPFAIKPLTLELLLRVWKAGGGRLPPTQGEIYEQGCLELCAESNPDRDTPRLRRTLSSAERLAIASHIAAATVFCKRSAISKKTKPSEVLETDLSFPELSKSSVLVDGQHVKIDDAALREALDTGLFSARGANRLGWAHQTYAEFLAARYCRTQQISSRQVLDLLVHPFDGKGLVPQLNEVASWIAKNDRDVFQKVLSSEPDILLRGDVMTESDSVKVRLLDALLSAAGREDFRPDWWALRARYRKLKHGKLSSQLQRIIRNKNRSSRVRCEAVRVIEECALRELCAFLATFALDSEEDQELRERATEVISKFGGVDIQKKLRPIALDQNSSLELRGWALNACWPARISAEEILATMVAPNYRRHGIYDRFLRGEFVEGLTDTDLPVALRWAADQPESHGSRSDGFSLLVTLILRRAALFLRDPVVLQEFASTMLHRLRKHDFVMPHEAESFIKVLEQRPDERLSVLNAMLLNFQDPRNDAFLITCLGVRFAHPQDLDWLLTRLGNETRPDIQKDISFVIYWVFRPDNGDRASRVIEAAAASPVLSEVLCCWLKPMDLSSEETANARKQLEEEKRWKKEADERSQPKILSPSLAIRIENCLRRAEAGDLDGWWQACWLAGIEDDGQNAENWVGIDLQELPGWKKASDDTKARFVSIARRFVVERQADGSFSWENKVHWPGLGGLRALLLLSKADPSYFKSLSKEVWVGWISALFSAHHYNELNEFRLLTAAALEKTQEESVEWVLKTLNKEDQSGNWLSILDRLPTELGTILGSALLSRLKQGRLKVTSTTQLLSFLVEHNVKGALHFATKCIPAKPPKKAGRRELALFASRLLLLHGEGGVWPKIWRLIEADTNFGKAFLEGGAHDYHHNLAKFVRTLAASEIGILWEWVRIQYPVENDPFERTHGCGGMITTGWAMADIRDGLIAYLAELGTVTAYKELHRLTKSYPKLREIRYMLSRCKEQVRRNTWQALSPKQLFKLGENRHSRFVQGADQLLELVCITLAGLQHKLHGETPAARFLWDKDRPKEEEALSDWIKIELESALIGKAIVLNREVQIHIKDRTDVHVDAIGIDPVTSELDRLKVIIEVKGCWHRELKTAMKSQLVERYLANNDCRHGIYLVFWFLCAAWSRRDSRARNMKFARLQILTRFLSRQASRLSTEDRSVKSLVLDGSLPWRRPRKPGSKRKVKVHASKTAKRFRSK